LKNEKFQKKFASAGLKARPSFEKFLLGKKKNGKNMPGRQRPKN
jgi:hypothetical protein